MKLRLLLLTLIAFVLLMDGGRSSLAGAVGGPKKFNLRIPYLDYKRTKIEFEGGKEARIDVYSYSCGAMQVNTSEPKYVTITRLEDDGEGCHGFVTFTPKETAVFLIDTFNNDKNWPRTEDFHLETN